MNIRPIPVLPVLLMASAAVSVVTAAGQRDRDANVLHVVLPRDAIPAIFKPEFEPASKGRLADRELVIGVVGENEQRAYSTWQLDRHEIVNDTFEGRPIAVTWCPLCGTGIVYARQLDDRVLSFGVSGMLFRDGLVMYDRETDTLWTQVDGKGVKGPLAGRALEVVPSVHATWKQWKQLYPDSAVLKKRGIPRSAYDAYNRNPHRAGILGRRVRDKRLLPKERVIGVRTDEAATAFVEKDVREAGLVQAEVGSLPIVLVAAGDDHPIVTFDRRAAGRVLSFRLAKGPPAAIEDTETGSRWSLADGKAISGLLKGAQLERAPAYPAFWFGWLGYFSNTEVWKR